MAGKTPEQIRKTFNIVNDFTPEEEEAVRAENKWCAFSDRSRSVFVVVTLVFASPGLRSPKQLRAIKCANARVGSGFVASWVNDAALDCTNALEHSARCAALFNCNSYWLDGWPDSWWL